MTSTRRILILIGLTLAVTIGAAIPASATFADSASIPTTTLGTGTVAAPASVTVTDSCVTTTTTTSQTTRTDPVTGEVTTTPPVSTTTTATSTSNIQGTTTSTTPGPGENETTTTTVTNTTELVVDLTWSASPSRDVSGYVVSAHLYGGAGLPMAQLPATTTSAGARVDANYLGYRPSLSVTTLTSYGWTATTSQTAVLAC
jgi:hypothetical protein